MVSLERVEMRVSIQAVVLLPPRTYTSCPTLSLLSLSLCASTAHRVSSPRARGHASPHKKGRQHSWPLAEGVTDGARFSWMKRQQMKLSQSLDALAQCIKLLSSGQSRPQPFETGSPAPKSSAGSFSSAASSSSADHIPFRSSAITTVLKEALVGNSHTVLLATCSWVLSWTNKKEKRRFRR